MEVVVDTERRMLSVLYYCSLHHFVETGSPIELGVYWLLIWIPYQLLGSKGLCLFFPHPLQYQDIRKMLLFKWVLGIQNPVLMPKKRLFGQLSHLLSLETD